MMRRAEFAAAPSSAEPATRALLRRANLLALKEQIPRVGRGGAPIEDLESGFEIEFADQGLALDELSDVIPNAVHLSLPRSERGQRRRPGVRLHTLNAPPTKREVRRIAGLPVTRPERTIVDSLATGTQPEQIQMAIRQALDRGITTPRRLRTAASRSSVRVAKFIERSLEESA